MQIKYESVRGTTVLVLAQQTCEVEQVVFEIIYDPVFSKRTTFPSTGYDKKLN